MLGNSFRPWGQAKWLFDKLPIDDWLIIGCVSTEDRCLPVLDHVFYPYKNSKAHFLEIRDLPFALTDECDRRRAVNREIYLRRTAGRGELTEHELLESPLRLKQLVKSVIAKGRKNVVVDISSLPKRFFFPLIKLLSKSPDIQNLVATYTVPEKYSEEQLAFEPQEWAYLPLFQREVPPPYPKCARVIVGVGFLPFRLPDLLKQDYQDVSIKLFFPFPPGPPQFQRNWRFVHEIEKTCLIEDSNDIIRIDAYDTSACFDHLVTLSGSDPQGTVLAPFGPKSHSLAMCLFASKFDCDVFYTQPKHYHPKYSVGVRMRGQNSETYSYSIKLNGKSVY